MQLSECSLILIADIENVLRDILADDEPGPHVSADAKPLALSYRIVQHAAVCPDLTAIRNVDDLSLLGRQIILQEGAEIPLADETDARGIFFAGNRIQLQLLCDRAHLRLGEIASRAMARISGLVSPPTGNMAMESAS